VTDQDFSALTQSHQANCNRHCGAYQRVVMEVTSLHHYFLVILTSGLLWCLSLGWPHPRSYQHTATAYNNFNPNLQDHAGGSNLSLQLRVQSPTGSWLQQALSHSLHHSSSDADQNTQQVVLASSQSLLNPVSFEPAQTQAAQTQSSLSCSGAVLLLKGLI
jgi:hypothetical protein